MDKIHGHTEHHGAHFFLFPATKEFGLQMLVDPSHQPPPSFLIFRVTRHPRADAIRPVQRGGGRKVQSGEFDSTVGDRSRAPV